MQSVLILVTPQLLMLKIIFPISVIYILVLSAGFSVKCWFFFSLSEIMNVENILDIL